MRSVCQALDDFSMFKWKVLGRHLGLSESLLEEINADFKQGAVRECFNEVLKAWLRWNYDETSFRHPTWHSLADAVKKSGDPAIAANIIAMQ